MKRYQLYLLLLLSVMIVGNVGCQQADQTAHEALRAVADQYMSEKTINDSLLDIACNYYLPLENPSDEREQCLLFRGAQNYLVARSCIGDSTQYFEKMQTATNYLLEVQNQIDYLGNSYYKGMVNFYLGCIYQDNGDDTTALYYFRQEVNYARQTDNYSAIALSYYHLSFAFRKIDNGDSALFYIDKALELIDYTSEELTNAIRLSKIKSLYQYHDEFSSDVLSFANIKTRTIRDSCIVINMVADYYKNNKEYAKADSLYQWILQHCDVPIVQHNAYSSRFILFQETGQLDSAIVMSQKMYKALDELNKVEDLATIEKIKQEFQEKLEHQKFQTKLSYITGSFLFVLLLLLILYIIKLQRIRRLENEIISVTEQIFEEQKNNDIIKVKLAQTISKNHKTENNLQNTKNLLIQNERTLHIKNNEILSLKKEKTTLQQEVNHKSEQNNYLQQRIESLLQHFILLQNNVNLGNDYYQQIVEMYAKLGGKRRDLIKALQNTKLSHRDIVICLLINERKNNQQDLWFVVGCQSENAFYSTKSQIKRKLEQSQDPIIQNLLKRFPLPKGPKEKTT